MIQFSFTNHFNLGISRRLISDKYLNRIDLDSVLKKIFNEGIFAQILKLLDTNHSILLRCSMEFLVFLYDAATEVDKQYKDSYINEVADIHYVSQILMIIENYQNEFKALGVNFLTKLIESEKVVSIIKRCFGFTMILNSLNSATDYNLRITILHLIKTLLNNEDNIRELRALGLINLLLLMFRKSKNVFERILILTSLHLISHEPEASIKLHDIGINILLKALLEVHPMRRNDSEFEDVAGADIEDLVKNYSLYLFRTLRSIFAVERNRKVIKQVFPPRLFALFVDVGNYVNEVENYAPVFREYVNMPNKEFEALERAIIDSSHLVGANENPNKYRKVGSYTLLQQLGKGAFGIVYLGRKGDNEFAIKELKTSDFEGSHVNTSHKNSSLAQAEHISKEVRIYKELSHPHIIKYYESFIEGEYVYIVMEHIDGFNLSDLIKLQAEKGAPFKENQIWTVVISLCGVLKYLHQEKSVIHRDLSPSNILIDRTFRVKLADFGLAKKITQSSSNLKAFVGTLNYTSPEVVENKPYTEKADIWSLGCLVYEMMTLKAPFYSPSPLLLAKKIVDNSYEKVTNSPYSQKLIDFMTLCLTPDPNHRPGIRQLIQLISEEILDFTHRVLEYEDYLKLQIINLKKKGKEPEPKFESNEGLKPKLIKIDNQDLVKMKQDPVSNFIEILRKMSIIVSTKDLGSPTKRDFKKYLIELFYKRVVANPKVPTNALRQELNKILTFSKEEMSIFKEVEFSLESTATDQFMMTGGMNYEKFYFFIEDKFKALSSSI